MQNSLKKYLTPASGETTSKTLKTNAKTNIRSSSPLKLGSANTINLSKSTKNMPEDPYYEPVGIQKKIE